MVFSLGIHDAARLQFCRNTHLPFKIWALAISSLPLVLDLARVISYQGAEHFLSVLSQISVIVPRDHNLGKGNENNVVHFIC